MVLAVGLGGIEQKVSEQRVPSMNVFVPLLPILPDHA